MAEQGIVVAAGAAPWAEGLAARLAEYGFRLLRYGDRRRYITRLVEDRAALLLVDGDDEGWRFWTTTPGASPATRRIPVVCVMRDPGRFGEAMQAGADLCALPGDLDRRLGAIITGLVYGQGDDQAARLACQCAEPLPEAARRGLELFNAGAYYRQHDVFEELWMQEIGPVRDLYRAILQVGVAYHHIMRGNLRGGRKMLLRAAQWLNSLPDACRGVDVAGLRADADRVRAALEALPEGAQLADFDTSLLDGVRLAGD